MDKEGSKDHSFDAEIEATEIHQDSPRFIKSYSRLCNVVVRENGNVRRPWKKERNIWTVLPIRVRVHT